MQKNENLHIQPESYIQRLGGLTFLDDHEPPIGIGGGGRLFVDIPQGVVLSDPPPSHGQYIYTFENTIDSKELDYTGISALLVVTETDNGYIDVVTYSTSAAGGAKLKLWFYDQPNPDFILEAAASVRQLTISSYLEPPEPTPTKPHRPYRRICSNPDSDVKKWELVGSDGTVLQDPITGSMMRDSGDDAYHFYVSFAHHHED